MKNVQVLGKGCSKCVELAKRVEAAAKELGLEVSIEKITDVNKMMEMGIMVTPGLAIEGVVKSTGHVPTVEAIKALLAA
jgi:small redox-active disulfide protein 2